MGRGTRNPTGAANLAAVAGEARRSVRGLRRGLGTPAPQHNASLARMAADTRHLRFSDVAATAALLTDARATDAAREDRGQIWRGDEHDLQRRPVDYARLRDALGTGSGVHIALSAERWATTYPKTVAAYDRLLTQTADDPDMSVSLYSGETMWDAHDPADPQASAAVRLGWPYLHSHAVPEAITVAAGACRLLRAGARDPVLIVSCHARPQNTAALAEQLQAARDAGIRVIAAFCGPEGYHADTVHAWRQAGCDTALTFSLLHDGQFF